MKLEMFLLAVLLLTGCASQGAYFESDIPGLATVMMNGYNVPLAKCGPGETATLSGDVTSKKTRINLNRERLEYHIICRSTSK
ncbi:MAG: hypothetical protein ACI9BF_000029 [Candidatus Paceibacteria bacterium]|jgi:hypothetical protein